MKTPKDKYIVLHVKVYTHFNVPECVHGIKMMKTLMKYSIVCERCTSSVSASTPCYGFSMRKLSPVYCLVITGFYFNITKVNLQVTCCRCWWTKKHCDIPLKIVSSKTVRIYLKVLGVYKCYVEEVCTFLCLRYKILYRNKQTYVYYIQISWFTLCHLYSYIYESFYLRIP